VDSGGAGLHRGGLGQRIAFKSLSPEPLTFMIRHERVKHPPRGFLGGLDGAAGLDLLDGVKIPAKSVISMKEGQVVTFETPGGGGMSSPHLRERSAVERDLLDGVVSAASAQRDYGLAESEIQQLLNANKGRAS
jgi:N-methylhydantoinase B